MQSFSLILFGATGDLAKIKILPAIYALFEQELLPGDFSLIGSGRTNHTESEFREYVTKVLSTKLGSKLDDSVLAKMLSHTYYCAGDTQDTAFYHQLSSYFQALKQRGVPCGNRVYHLAILPELYEKVVSNLGETGLNQSPDGWTRIMIEKPFGHDEASARALNTLLSKHFPEQNIFRLDHYLGKETVMNILAFRFGNGLFEPIWNYKFIDHIQITTAEEFGVSSRGRFYDATGALRDVLQNHLLQVLATTLMDRPADFSVGKVRSERQHVLGAIIPYKTAEVKELVVSGMYDGYLQEKDIPDSSRTETFVALKLSVDKPRWRGVPIYIRTGKKLSQTVSEVSVVFKRPPFQLLEHETSDYSATVLTLRLQPNEAIMLRLAVKRPGPKMILTPANLEFNYGTLQNQLLDAYVKLLLDAFQGDQTNFAMMQEVTAQWRVVDPIVNAWENGQKLLHSYNPGTWGPDAAHDLIAKDGRQWLAPAP